MYNNTRWLLLLLPWILHIAIGCLGIDSRLDALLAQTQLENGVILYDVDTPADDMSWCPSRNEPERLRNGARVTFLAFSSSFSKRDAFDAVRFSNTDEWPVYVIKNDYLEVALEPAYYLACFWNAGLGWPAACGKIQIQDGSAA